MDAIQRWRDVSRFHVFAFGFAFICGYQSTNGADGDARAGADGGPYRRGTGDQGSVEVAAVPRVAGLVLRAGSEHAAERGGRLRGSRRNAGSRQAGAAGEGKGAPRRVRSRGGVVAVKGLWLPTTHHSPLT